MARLYPTLMVVPILLAACATSAPVSSPHQAAYLEGRTSDYSIRVDELEKEGFQKLCKELPKALVAVKLNAQVSEPDLIAFCRERLARFKVPKIIEFVDELPKTGSGQILKVELRKRFGGAES